MANDERVEKVEMRQIDIAVPRTTFRLVNGERVRISQRDPTKLYRSVHDGNEAYDLELTEEEHRQRNEEIARWEAEAPQREAERQRQDEEYRKFQDSLRYEKRVVAFLDVLGWRRAISDSISDPKLAQHLGVALHSSMATARLAEWMRQNVDSEKAFGDPQVTQFSDSVVISTIAQPNAEDQLVFHLRAAVAGFLQLGYLVRGGIAEGNLIHRGQMVYGSALTAAYDIEHKVARHPRIVLDEPLAHRWGSGMRIIDQNDRTIGFRRYWRRDKDGLYFYDFLVPIPGMPNPSREMLKPHLQMVHSMLVKKLDEPQLPGNVRAKYFWIAKYFNSFIEEYEIDSVERIRIPIGVRVKGWLFDG